MGCGASSEESDNVACAAASQHTPLAVGPIPSSFSRHHPHAGIIPEVVRHTTVPQRSDQEVPVAPPSIEPLLAVEPLVDGVAGPHDDGDRLSSCRRDSPEASRNFDFSDPGQQFAAGASGNRSDSQLLRHGARTSTIQNNSDAIHPHLHGNRGGGTAIARFHSLDTDAPPMQSGGSSSRTHPTLPVPPPVQSSASAMSSTSPGMSLPTPFNEEELGIQQQHEQLSAFCVRFQSQQPLGGPVRGGPATPHAAHSTTASASAGDLMFTPTRSRCGTPTAGSSHNKRISSTSSRSLFARSTALPDDSVCLPQPMHASVPPPAPPPGNGMQSSWNVSEDLVVVDPATVGTTTSISSGRTDAEQSTKTIAAAAPALTTPTTPITTGNEDFAGNVYRSPSKTKAKSVSIRSRNNSSNSASRSGFRSDSPSVSTPHEFPRTTERSFPVTSFSDVTPAHAGRLDDGAPALSGASPRVTSATCETYEFSFEQLGRPST